jgi:hypothetical protein
MKPDRGSSEKLPDSSQNRNFAVLTIPVRVHHSIFGLIPYSYEYVRLVVLTKQAFEYRTNLDISRPARQVVTRINHH